MLKLQLVQCCAGFLYLRCIVMVNVNKNVHSCIIDLEVLYLVAFLNLNNTSFSAALTNIVIRFDSSLPKNPFSAYS